MNLNEQKEKLRMELPSGMLKKLDDFFHGGQIQALELLQGS